MILVELRDDGLFYAWINVDSGDMLVVAPTLEEVLYLALTFAEMEVA